MSKNKLAWLATQVYGDMRTEFRGMVYLAKNMRIKIPKQLIEKWLLRKFDGCDFGKIIIKDMEDVK